ncbi:MULTISPECIES: hypothetical protein [unclassified Rhizobium]|uniref:hypothetical protein n=1 Tax=unclassified Rhizobium TaxID=2613769 RepID=UPI000DD8331B|nr:MULTISPECIES: hypothetical protein [unclassified Rhizobium]MBO9123208.1 hypothetical protein [Rhizobium sp. 16-488-2b]MBO9173740.1 hypothetical protein [Rhizobium sp. 16-488-2a]
MAIVIALADRLSRTPGRKERSSSVEGSPLEAQILLYTGVRYERLTDPDKPTAVRRASRSKTK